MERREREWNSEMADKSLVDVAVMEMVDKSALLMLPRRSFTGSSFTINLSQRTGNHVPKNGSEKNLED